MLWHPSRRLASIESVPTFLSASARAPAPTYTHTYTHIQVHGASGGVGLAAVQLAAAAGMRVIGTASSPKGRELVLAAGASLAVDHRAEGYLEAAAAATAGGAGFDVVVEMLANVNLPKARSLQMNNANL